MCLINIAEGDNMELKKVGTEIFLLPAVELAPKLLGKLLCRCVDGNIIKARITEAEAYSGEEDTACHAHKGKTPRAGILWRRGGTSYVYLCYGMHEMFNVVSGLEDEPGAVLIRGVTGYSGPGRVTKAMKIDRSLNGDDMTVSDRLWVEDDGTEYKYHTSPRVGIDYATEEYRLKPWRFIADIN